MIAWEPVPQFRAFFEYNVARNGLTGRVQVRPAAAVARPGRGNYTVVVPQRGIWGTAGIDGANIDHLIDNEGEYERVAVNGESLDQVGAGGGFFGWVGWCVWGLWGDWRRQGAGGREGAAVGGRGWGWPWRGWQRP